MRRLVELNALATSVFSALAACVEAAAGPRPAAGGQVSIQPAAPWAAAAHGAQGVTTTHGQSEEPGAQYAPEALKQARLLQPSPLSPTVNAPSLPAHATTPPHMFRCALRACTGPPAAAALAVQGGEAEGLQQASLSARDASA